METNINETISQTYEENDNVFEGFGTKKCIDCGEQYSADEKKQAKNRCKQCKVDTHGCIKGEKLAASKSKGNFWLCEECTSTFENLTTMRETMIQQYQE